MSLLAIRLLAGFFSSSTRVAENYLSITNDAERYLNGEINFEQATDNVVQQIHIYPTLLAIKFGSDAIVLSMTGKWIYNVVSAISSVFRGIIQGGLSIFLNRIKLSVEHFLSSLQNCSIPLILSQFKFLYNRQKTYTSSIPLVTLCDICDHIYLLIIGGTCGFKKSIQIELMKYYLECTGIIRAIAERNNINFIKYMETARSKNSINNPQPFNLNELQCRNEKDPDIHRTIRVTLEDIFHGKIFEETITREIRIIGNNEIKIEEETYPVPIEPGCPDEKEFRFQKVGDRDPVNYPADLVVKVQTEQHPLYERQGANLIYTANILLKDALKGTPIQVPSIDGTMVECNPHGVINTKTKVIIKHAGLPNPSNNGIRGDMIVKYDIEFPDTKIGIEPTE